MSNNLSDGEFIKFRNLIYKYSGIFYDDLNRVVLENKIRDKLSSISYSPYQYYDFLLKNRNALKEFLDIATTNQTKFFRLPSVLKMFKNILLPKIIEKNIRTGNSVLKIWSAGCSTGEEPYSVAMILESMLPSNMQYKVIASDISLQSLLKARDGIYSYRQIYNIPVEYRKYIERVSDTDYKIKDFVKKKVIFDYHNLKLEANSTNVDIVFCLNVLIYFDINSKREVLANFYNCMKCDGFLFLAQSENLFNVNLPFKLITSDYGFYYQKKG